MSINVLITSAGNNNGLRLIKSVKKTSKFKKIKIFATDRKKILSSCPDKIFIVSSTKKKFFVKKLIEIVKQNKIELIIPGSDSEAIVLSKNKLKFQKFNCKIACLNYKFLRKFADKQATYKTLDKLQLRHALWFKAENFMQLKKYIKNLENKKKEIVVKPIFSRGGRNVSIIRKKLSKVIKKNFGREIHMNKKYFFINQIKKYKSLFPLIVMERLYEPSYDFDLLSWKGKLLKVVTRKRLGSQGVNGCVLEFNKKKFINYAKQIAKGFNLSWLHDCDIMFNKSGLPVIIELNPRISGSLYSSIESKIPLIDDLIYMAKGQINKIKKIKFSNDIKIIKRKKN